MLIHLQMNVRLLVQIIFLETQQQINVFKLVQLVIIEMSQGIVLMIAVQIIVVQTILLGIAKLNVQMEHGDITLNAKKFVHQGILVILLIEIVMIWSIILQLIYSLIKQLKPGFKFVHFHLYFSEIKLNINV